MLQRLGYALHSCSRVMGSKEVVPVLNRLTIIKRSFNFDLMLLFRGPLYGFAPFSNNNSLDNFPF